jgi:hypothetical protein
LTGRGSKADRIDLRILTLQTCVESVLPPPKPSVAERGWPCDTKFELVEADLRATMHRSCPVTFDDGHEIDRFIENAGKGEELNGYSFEKLYSTVYNLVLFKKTQLVRAYLREAAAALSRLEDSDKYARNALCVRDVFLYAEITMLKKDVPFVGVVGILNAARERAGYEVPPKSLELMQTVKTAAGRSSGKRAAEKDFAAPPSPPRKARTRRQAAMEAVACIEGQL